VHVFVGLVEFAFAGTMVDYEGAWSSQARVGLPLLPAPVLYRVHTTGGCRLAPKPPQLLDDYRRTTKFNSAGEGGFVESCIEHVAAQSNKFAEYVCLPVGESIGLPDKGRQKSKAGVGNFLAFVSLPTRTPHGVCVQHIARADKRTKSNWPPPMD